MNFASVQSVTIPEGEARSIAIGGVTVWTKPNPLPYDAEVEYLESTGTQYVDTGILLAQPGKVVEYRARFAYTSLSTPTARYSICGAYEGSGSGRRNGYTTTRHATSSSMAIAIASSAPNTSAVAAVGTIYDFWVKIDDPAKRVTVTSGGATILNKAISGDYPTITNYLFARNGSTPAEFSSARIFAFTQFVGGTLVRSFVPVRVGTVGYLFDRANPTGGPLGNGLYGSATGTPLVVGPDKNGGTP